MTLLPLCFVGVTTLTAGYMIVRDRFWPMAIGPNPALNVQGYVNSICTSFMMVLVVLILASAARRCFLVLSGKAPVRELAQAYAEASSGLSCCLTLRRTPTPVASRH